MPVIHLVVTNYVDYNPIPFSYDDPVTALPVSDFINPNQVLDLDFLVPSGIYNFNAVVNGTPWPSIIDASDCQIYGPGLITTSFQCSGSCGDAGQGPIYLVAVTHPGTPNDPQIFVQIENGPIVILCGGETTSWDECVPDGDPCVTRIVSVNIDGVFYNQTFDGQAECCEPADDCPPLEIQGLVPCRDDAILGDGQDLRVLIMTRGGTAVIAEITPVGGNFTRDLDATSTLTLDGVISGRLGEVCCDGWEDIYSWATEVIVYRDGRDAWCGPVTGVTFGYGTVHVEASDLSAWWDRRVLPTMAFNGMDLGTIFQRVHEAAMAPDPSPNIILDVLPTGITGTRSINASSYIYAADFLTELAATDLDFTAFGRTIIVRGPEINQEPYFTLLDEYWTEPPQVKERGNEQATVVIVKGNGVQSIATASASYLEFYGYLVRVFTEDTIKDQASCDIAAQSRLDLLKDPVYIETPSGAKLKTIAPILLEQLIPGVRMRVDTQSTCRKVVADFRLKKVSVDFNGDVSIDLQPIGSLEDLEAQTNATTISGGDGGGGGVIT